MGHDKNTGKALPERSSLRPLGTYRTEHRPGDQETERKEQEERMKQDISLETPELRAQFTGMQAGDFVLVGLTLAQTPWFEDEEAIRRGLEWGRKKARMLRWVESQMVLRLSPIERRCIELYYFEALNYREAALVLDVHASSVYRAVRRGIRKLQQAARDRPGF